jgi:hypothetical protein
MLPVVYSGEDPFEVWQQATSTVHENWQLLLHLDYGAPLIFKFLGPRELYNMTLTSKTIMQQLRHGMVIRSTVLQQAPDFILVTELSPKRNLPRIISLMKGQSIRTRLH